ncbi:response regulator [Desulfosediminicola ganghwensis]|uniref:response regulator n=1 Tax=Desulfosediminicola ganghwensis TaxID=2569540 RepID=UPI0010AD830C|nr:response regulator [Desulfosediminicola ganghwensis]
MEQTILIVEDARELAQLLSDYLRQAGFGSHQLYSGDGVIDWVKNNQPDLILLDLMLPGRGGLEICAELRQFSTVPVIMLTARVEEQDRLRGLELGADDYVCKPFSPREVVARVKAVLRRSSQRTLAENTKVGIQFDADKLQVRLNGNLLNLTVVEYHLLALLAGQPGRIYSRGQLIDKIYPDQRVVSDRTIDSHIKKLRKKISEVYSGELIHSVYSAGYKFDATES